MLECAGYPLKTFVDTGSVATLITETAWKLTKANIFKCNKSLTSVSNHTIEVLGQIMLPVSVTPHLKVTHRFIVVPNKYLSTDVLMGADLIGRALFAWDGQSQELHWAGHRYPVTNVQAGSVNKVYWRLKNSAKDNPHVAIAQVGKRIRIPGDCMCSVPISVRGVTPGNLVQVDVLPNLARKFKKVLPINSYCIIVNDNCTVAVPIVNTGRKPVLFKPGHIVATVTLLEDCQVEKLESNASLISNTSGQPIGAISNALLPHMDEAVDVSDRNRALRSLVKDLDWSHLDQSQKDKLTACITNHNQLFVLSQSELGEMKVGEAGILVNDPTPVRMPLYRQPEQAKAEIAKLITNMLEKGVIEESTAAYLAPIVLVKKPDGSRRMCIDYRGLNQNLKMDLQPLPRLDELVESSAGRSFYCNLDLRDAYYQVKLDSESRDLTTFSDGLNLYRFCRLPFGLSVSPAIFTRKIQEVLAPLLKQGWCRNYLDDVVLWADSFDQMLNRLSQTFTRLSEMGVKLNVSKCAFGVKKVKFLGHIVSAQGIKPDPKNVEAVNRMPSPGNLKQVRRFMGMVNFYRKHIPKLAFIASPITDLLRKDVPFQWNAECQKAFIELKRILTTYPVLVKADQTKPFQLHTDASKSHVGASLMQVEDDHSLKPIGFFSKKLNATERRYSVTDKEAMAVVEACRFFFPYLWCKPFTVVTDHKPLTWIFKRKTKCPRMSRYILELRDYSFTIRYKKGAQHSVPDALSRPVCAINQTLDPTQMSSVKFLGLTCKNIVSAQREDKIWTKVIRYLEGGHLPKKITGNCPIVAFELHDKLLYVRKRDLNMSRLCLVIPQTLVAVACALTHNSAHLGERKTLQKAKQYFYWPKMPRDISQFVKSCRLCQQYKGHGALVHHWHELPPVEDNGQRVAIDLIDLHQSRNGHRFCLTVLDHFSRYLRIYPLRNKNTKTVATEFMKDICRYGKPKVVVMDNGGEFSSFEFREFCRQAEIKQAFCLPYHPRGNSVIERAHRTLKTILAILSQEHPNTWPAHIDKTERAHNEAVHTSLGTSPFFAFYGRHPNREIGQLQLPSPEMEDDQINVKELLKETV